MNKHILPRTGFVRLPQIIGSKNSPEITPLIPVSRTTWWRNCRTGVYPKPIRIGKNITAWRWEDIHQLIEKLNRGGF